MSRIVQLSVVAAAAAFLALGAQAGTGEPAGVKSSKLKGEAITTSHKLQRTYFDTDAPGSSLIAGFNTVGTALTVNCTNTAGCTVAANMNAQIAAVGTENAAAICLKVNGSYVNCPFNAIVRAGGGYQVMNYQTFTSVPLGNSTIEMEVYSSQAGSALYRWNKEIKLYKP
ncbi:MAG: hypothetical protein U1F53_10890 [Burkholderiaceae bacterium]